MLKRIQSLVLAMICCFMAVSASTYYCSPAGTGNGRSIDSPADFDAAFSSWRGGDTLYCLSGVYYRDNRITIGSSKQGTADARTVIAAAAGHKPIFDFYQEPYGERGFVIGSGVQYIHMRGLTLRYSGKNALFNQGSYCLFENLDVYGNGDSGVQMKNGGYNVIKNCDSHDNFDYKTMSGSNANYGGNADGFADKQFTGAPNHYIACRAWNNSDDGWDFYERNTLEGEILLEECVCYRSGPPEYDLTSNPRIQTDADWFGHFPQQVIDRYGNSVEATLWEYPNIGNGNGFKIGGARTTNNIRLVNCLAVGCAYRGFDQNNNAGAMTLYNCTAYDNNPNYGFGNIQNSSLTIRNCISFHSRQGDDFGTPTLVSDHNSWTISGIYAGAGDFASLDTALYMLVPRLADCSLQKTPLLRLVRTSNMIDAGVNVGLPYAGSAPDLGCYEFGDDMTYPAQLTCTGGSLQQTVVAGNAISPVTLTWGGCARDVTCDNLPAGIAPIVSMSNRTIRFIGTIAEPGVYTIVVTTVQDESAIPASQTIKIYVKSADASKVAFLTVPNSASDALILDRLNSDTEFSVDILDAGNAVSSLTGYDLLVISSAPASNSAGTMSVKGARLPTLLLKPFQLKSTAWNWANAVNTADRQIKVLHPEHPIFTNVNVVDGKADMFSRVTTNAVTAVNQWYGGTQVNILATAVSNDGYQSVVEIPTGTTIDGVMLEHRFLMLGVSEYSTANLTSDALTLINNACRYLLGREIRTALPNTAADVRILREASAIVVESDVAVASMTLYTALGARAAYCSGNRLDVSGLQSGVYLLRVTTMQGEATVKVLL